MIKRNSRFEDCLTMEQFTGADYWEPDQLLVYSTDVFLEEEKRRSRRIYLKNLCTGSISRITAGGVAEEQPVFSPDGTKIAFLAVVPGKGRQLYVYNRGDGSVTQVTAIGAPVMEPIWSPDGSRILFLSPSSSGARPPQSDEPIVIENLNYKFDGRGFYRPDTHLHLWITETATGNTTRITDGAYNYMHHNWLPDGKAVICGSNRYRRAEESIGMDLVRIDLMEGFPVTRLSEKQYMVSYPNPVRPVCTPDGKSVVVGYLDLDISKVLFRESTTYPNVYLHRVAADGSRDEILFHPSESCYQCVQFPYNASCGSNMDKAQMSEDGKTVYFLSGFKGQCVLYALDISGDGTARTVLSGKQAVNGLGRVQNGKMLVSISTEVEPESYRILDLITGKLSSTVAQCAEELLSTVAYSQPEDFFFRTIDGDSEVHGWALPPQNRKPGEKYPVILYIHGGPQPFYTYGFTHEHQCFAGEGFGVLYCNFRGSSSYGWNHQQISKAQGGEAYMDNLQMVQEACRRFDWIDLDRIGVTGGSYGGWMTNYIATHAKQFKAYITQRSVVNRVIMYASSDMSGNSRGYASIDEFMLQELKVSPVIRADHIDKPFLILHGMDDLRTPVEGAHQLYTAIKDTHPELPVKMVLFPHTAHNQPGDPQMLLRYYKEMVQWFRAYL